jgi:hypothetical protein
MLTAYTADGAAIEFAHPIDVKEGIEAGYLFAQPPGSEAKPDAAKEEPKEELKEEPKEEPKAEPDAAKAPGRQPPARRA